MLKEAIAEAKTIKETAIANAKAALEEAFTPQLTAMFAERLNEENEMEEEGMYETTDMEDEGLEESFNLDEILAELEMTDEADSVDEDLMLEEMSDEEIEELVMKVIDDMIETGKLMPGEGEEDEEDMEDVEDMGDEEVEIEDEIDEMVDNISSDELDDPYDTGKTKNQPMDEEISLDELLNELLDEEKDELNEGISPEIGALLAAVGLPLTALGVAKLSDMAKEGKLGVIGKKVINFLEKAGAAASPKNTGGGTGGVSEVKKDEELEEAYKAIDELRSELNEVNLLNAKLLYTNKIFKAKNLTESEKVKVLNTFDKAETVKEVKLVFETLTESFKATAKKTAIKESLGSASKTIAPTQTKQPIIEVNDAFARMQRLAGLKK